MANEEHVDGAHREVTPSAELAEIVGRDPLPRTEVTSRVWDYIKQNGLQDDADGRQINADDKLKAVVGDARIDMFTLTERVNDHLS